MIFQTQNSKSFVSCLFFAIIFLFLCVPITLKAHLFSANENLDPFIDYASVIKKYKEDLRFVQNEGQYGDHYKYVLENNMLNLGFDDQQIMHWVIDQEKEQGFAWSMQFNNSNPLVFRGVDKQDNINHIYNDDNYITEKSYKEIWSQNVYDGIDLRYYSRGNGLVEFDFLVNPKVDPNQISYSLDGVDDISVDPDGRLKMETSLGDLYGGKPYVYQVIDGKEIEINSKYIVNNQSVSFDLGEYDTDYVLVIDPISLDWSTFLAGTAAGAPVDIEVTADGVYVTGVTYSNDFPTTPGVFQPAFGGGDTDAYLAKFDHDGNLIWSTLFGGSGHESVQDLAVVAGNVVIVGVTEESLDLPVSAGAYQPTVGSDELDGFVASFDDSGQQNWATYIGGDGFESDLLVEIEGSSVIVGGSTYSTDLGTVNPIQSTLGGMNDNFLGSLDLATGNMNWLTYLGGTNQEAEIADIDIDGTNIYVAGSTTFSSDFPVSSGAHQTTLNGGSDGYLLNMDLGGTLNWATYIGGDGDESINDLDVDGGQIVIGGNTGSINGLASAGAYDPTIGGFADGFIASFQTTGTLNYATYIGSDSDNVKRELVSQVEIDNGEVYFLVDTGEDFPVTAGAILTNNLSGQGVVLGKLDATGNLAWATYYGDESKGSAYAIDLEVEGGIAYVYIQTDGTGGLIMTPDAVQEDVGGGSTTGLGVFSDDGNLIYSTYWGGCSKYPDTGQDLEVYNGDIYLIMTGNFESPVTTDAYQISGPEEQGSVITKFTPSPDFTDNIINSPITQTTCQFGLAEIIDATKVFIPEDDLPVIKCGGTFYNHPPIEAEYQWQKADSPTGPWTSLPYGLTEDFLPSVGGLDAYYRRLAVDAATGIVISESNVVDVLVNSFVAPDVDAGGAFYTCPNVAVTLGGAPSGDGDAPPFTYAWDMATSLDNETLANPVATVPVSTIFTLTVTDANACSQIDQAVVNVVQADAGPDQGACEGVPVRIGTAAIPGLAGASYTWTPSAGLDVDNIAMPLASPAAATTYTLTLEIPTQTGVCSTTDDVLITPVAHPGADFAGPDQTICYGTTTTIGVGPAGYNYTWAPGNYLVDNDLATVTFDPGTSMPNPNPITYFVTAESNGCYFYDDVELTVLRAEAGVDGCGPRTVGGFNQPNIAPTYTWTNVTSGPGDFIGTTDIPFTTVSSSGTGSTTYQIDVSKNGTTCTDQVIVPPCGCVVGIGITEPIGCPVLFPGNTLTMVASAGGLSGGPYDYSWTPTTGLSDPNSNVTQVTVTDHITYTVNVNSPIDGSFICSGSIEVNNPAWSLPTFTANDPTICPGESVAIGAPAVTGYTYEWIGPDLEDFTSNPTVTPDISDGEIKYYVTVTDTGSGCFTRDTATVTVQGVIADAGPDWEVCDNAIVKLGSPDPSNGVYTYLWAPIAPWQNGTDETSAQPEVLMSTSLEFQLTVTNPVTGCFELDTAMVNVMTNPTIEDSPDVVYCPGTDPIQIGPVPIPDVIYTWMPATGLSCTDCAQPLASPSATETYTVFATFPGCGVQAMDNVTVTIPDHSFDLMGPVVFCPADGPVTIGDNAPASATAYAWSPGSGLSCTNCANPTATITAETTYTLEATFSDGCKESAMITVMPSSDPNAGGDKTICVGASTAIGSASNSGNISWSPGTGLSCTDCPSPIFEPTTGGSVTFTISMESGGCTNTDEVTVNVDEFVPPTIAPQAVCQGGCTVLEVPLVAGNSYVWYNDDGFDAEGNSVLVCPTSTTTYNLLIQDASTGCFGTTSGVVTVADVPAPEGVIEDQDFCVGDGAMLLPLEVLPAGGDYVYVWGPTTYLSNPYIQQPEVFPVNSISYYVTITDNANGCSSVADVNVNVVPCNDACSLNANAESNGPLCEGEELQLTSGISGGVDPVTIMWSGPNGYSSMDADPIIMMTTTVMSGDYTLTVMDGDDCMVVSTVTVEIGANPSLVIDEVSCSVDMLTYNVSFSSDGVITSSSGNIEDGLITGIDIMSNVTITSTLGDCVETMEIEPPMCECPDVNQPFNPSELSICDGEDIPELTIEVDAGLEANWYDAAMGGNQIIANSLSFTPAGPLSPGMYTYYVESRDASSDCTSDFRAEVSLVINDNPTANPSNSGPVCQGSEFNLMAGNIGGVGPYTYAWSGPDGFSSTDANPAVFDVTAAMDGDYTVLITDGNGCTAEGLTNLIVVESPTHPDMTGNCNDNNTPFDSTDDYTEFVVSPTGPSGESFSLSIDAGTISPATGTYGTPLNVRLENNSAGNGGTRIITILSNEGPGCGASFTLSLPENCSEDCPQGCYEIEIIRD